jgi:hypothetical protein
VIVLAGRLEGKPDTQVSHERPVRKRLRGCWKGIIGSGSWSYFFRQDGNMRGQDVEKEAVNKDWSLFVQKI